MELNVISFNILCCDASNGNSIAQRAPRVKAVIDQLDPDLIGFQEATPVWLEILNQDYGTDYVIYNVYRGQNSQESTPVAWKQEKYDCLDKGTLWFSDTPEVESRGWDERYPCPRIFSWVRLKEKISGQEFCFINTHFGFGTDCQTKSARMLAAFARKMGCPCVITGDFNMKLDSDGYRIMNGAFLDVNAGTANDLSPTFHGFDPATIGEHIDYCFTTEDIHPLSFQIVRQMPGGGYPSDHYCIQAVVEL